MVPRKRRSPRRSHPTQEPFHKGQDACRHDLPFFFFFLRKMLNVREKSVQGIAQEKALKQCPNEKRASRNTSCTDGMSAPVPWTGRRSNKDNEKARAAEHANTALHRRMYAAWTLPCNTRGDSRALALVKADRKVAVSSFHRPPTSAASATKRARPPSPETAPL